MNRADGGSCWQCSAHSSGRRRRGGCGASWIGGRRSRRAVTLTDCWHCTVHSGGRRECGGCANRLHGGRWICCEVVLRNCWRCSVHSGGRRECAGCAERWHGGRWICCEVIGSCRPKRALHCGCCSVQLRLLPAHVLPHGLAYAGHWVGAAHCWRYT